MMNVLAYDLGGSSFRLAVINSEKTITHLVQLPLKIPMGHGGEYEADPSSWWESFLLACRTLTEKGADLSTIKAIVGCGFTRTQVPLNARGDVVHPAITFQDSRGSRALAEYLEAASPGLEGRVPNLSPYHPIARLIWLKKRKPDVWAKVTTILEPKDYINFKLTGAWATDRISIDASKSFFDAIEGDDRSTDALGISRDILPKAVSPFDTVGMVRDDVPSDLSPLVGKPVVCGSTDTWTCVLGSGGLNPGAAYNISGTSDVFGVISRQRFACKGLMTVQWGPEQWQLGGPSQGAASRLSWAVDRYMPGVTIEQAMVEAFNDNTQLPIFLPFLEGERAPFWDADLKGAFLGICQFHTGADFVRSVAEGINFLSRLVLKMAEEATREPVSHVCFSGGLSNSAILCQLKADCLNRPVFAPKIKESGLVGSASMAFLTSSSIADITAELMKDGSWYRPNPAMRDFYDERFSIFEDGCSAVAGLSHRISQLNKTLDMTRA
ncbi:FGGY-family carbohydrate kinase [uncultured Roseibium sp.]|uniref:xylulokinase n=1 Tax=uncultured Roseibium sp. TaxID=1936171 RepID=UPI003216F3BE